MASDVPFQTARSGGSGEHESRDHPVPKRTDMRGRLQHAVAVPDVSNEMFMLMLMGWL